MDEMKKDLEQLGKMIEDTLKQSLEQAKTIMKLQTKLDKIKIVAQVLRENGFIIIAEEIEKILEEWMENSETMLVKELIKKYSIDFALGYLSAMVSLENPPNNGIDYKWALNWLKDRI